MSDVDKMYKSYQAERAMLSDEMRRKREDEITAKEKAARDLQKSALAMRATCLKSARN